MDTDIFEAKIIFNNSVVREVYAALYELNIECDLLYDRETDWSSYRLLIFPQLYCASDEMIERIRAFTAGGGTIFVLFRSFFADQNLQIRNGRQPYGLTDVFGMHYSRFTKSENHYWMELLETDGSEIKSYYSEKYWNEHLSYLPLPGQIFSSGISMGKETRLLWKTTGQSL